MRDQAALLGAAQPGGGDAGRCRPRDLRRDTAHHELVVVSVARQTVRPEGERETFIDERKAEYVEDVDLLRLASEVVVDAVIQPEELRRELIMRFRYASKKDRDFSSRRHGIPPV